MKKKEGDMENEQRKMRSELEGLIARHEMQVKEWRQRASEDDSRRQTQRAQLEADHSKLKLHARTKPRSVSLD